MVRGTPEKFLKALFERAVHAASADETLSAHLPPPPKGRTLMIALGKAAAAMARVALAHRPDIARGVILIPYGHGDPALDPPPGIDLIEARHPIPDARGVQAAQAALRLARELGEGDQLLALISGGGSSLLTLPGEGLSLAQKKAVTRQLLDSGADIREINAVRARLSAIKGGRLAAAASPARVVTLVISDVPGDDPAFVASGPTVSMSGPVADAADILKKYNIDFPVEALPPARASRQGPANHKTMVIATGDMALAAAADHARAEGVARVLNLGAGVTGDAATLGRQHGELALGEANRLRQTRQKRPRLILSGGETSVTLGAGPRGVGGRNTEYLLSLAMALRGRGGIYALACDTDGIDGAEQNAGAIITPDTVARAGALGLNPAASLNRHDAYPFFRRLDDLIITGPTRTNVNDFRAILILPE